jgi:hypothetical protein
MPLQTLQDRYRCPEKFFNCRTAPLTSAAGYFQFGSETVCYGRTTDTRVARSNGSLIDVQTSVVADAGQLVLPFDLDEVVNNLRLERYPAGQMGTLEKYLKRIYYLLRPHTLPSVRHQIHRFRAGNWKSRPFPQWPVDTSVERICENVLLASMCAEGHDSVPFIWFWPRGARSAVTMTHDVETVAGRDFCTSLMDIDDRYGIKSSFQIVPEARYAVTPEFLGEIRERGFEICVQDLNHDGRLFDHRREFLRRAETINEYARQYRARGYRSAVLYRNAEWLPDLEFSFDMSFPNVAHLDPQRGGCCTVMPYFIGPLLELPLTTTQDYTLFHVLGEQSLELWKAQTAAVVARHGLVSFLVHPDYILTRERCELYEALLSMLTDLRGNDQLWFARPGEIDRWWRARHQMSLVRRDRGWEIVGDDAEDAVVAFATVVDGRLVYEIRDSQRVDVAAGSIPSISGSEPVPITC